MDSISHLITGTALGSLKTGSISLDNPCMIGCLAGALSPDFDIITYFTGHQRYLKWHRGFTHSIPGILMQNFAITFVLKYLYKASNTWEILAWTFLGLFSHIFLDVLNSYGIRLWPKTKKIFLDILPLFDPILLGLFILAILTPLTYSYLILGIAFLAYPLLRLYLRKRSRQYLEHSYPQEASLIRLMPATTNPLKWDFILRTSLEVLRGQISTIDQNINILFRFKRISRQHPALATVYQSKLGHYFEQFTPLAQPVIKPTSSGYEIKLYDLRYLKHNTFLHSGTAYLNKQLQVERQYLHPHSPRISINMN